MFLVAVPLLTACLPSANLPKKLAVMPHFPADCIGEPRNTPNNSAYFPLDECHAQQE
jgi:hypothetical protein